MARILGALLPSVRTNGLIFKAAAGHIFLCGALNGAALQCLHMGTALVRTQVYRFKWTPRSVASSERNMNNAWESESPERTIVQSTAHYSRPLEGTQEPGRYTSIRTTFQPGQAHIWPGHWRKVHALSLFSQYVLTHVYNKRSASFGAPLP